MARIKKNQGKKRIEEAVNEALRKQPELQRHLEIAEKKNDNANSFMIIILGIFGIIIMAVFLPWPITVIALIVLAIIMLK